MTSGVDASELTYGEDGRVVLHEACVTDIDQPVFDADWQRRAFGLAVALAEFKHYAWGEFQSELIAAIGSWEEAPADARGRWEYYEHWVDALARTIERHGLLEDGYEGPDDDDHHAA